MLWSGFISRLFKEAKPYLRVRGNDKHARVSHGYALKLLDREPGDRKIVEPAVILHDVGWSCLEPEQIALAYGVRAGGREARALNRVHEIQGATIAGRILQTLDYDPVATERIFRIIARHDSGTKIASPEEGLVKDADKLWRFSKIGFWQETERQHISADELYRHLDQHRSSWFFSATARDLAETELQQRSKEMDRVAKAPTRRTRNRAPDHSPVG